MEALLLNLLRPEEAPAVKGGLVNPQAPAGAASFTAQLLASVGPAGTNQAFSPNGKSQGASATGQTPQAISLASLTAAQGEPLPAGLGIANGRGQQAEKANAEAAAAGIATQHLPTPFAADGAEGRHGTDGAVPPVTAQTNQEDLAAILQPPAATSIDAVPPTTPVTPAIPATQASPSAAGPAIPSADVATPVKAPSIARGNVQPDVPQAANASRGVEPQIPGNPAPGSSQETAARGPVTPNLVGNASDDVPVRLDQAVLKPNPAAQEIQLAQTASRVAVETGGAVEVPRILRPVSDRSGQPAIQTQVAPTTESGAAETVPSSTSAPDLLRVNRSAAPNEQPGTLTGAQNAQGAASQAASPAAAATPTAHVADPLPLQLEPVGNPAPAVLPGQPPATAADIAPDFATRPLAQQQAATDQVALAVHRAVGENRERISLRLHPAELGRIDVRLETGDDGVLRAVILAEKPTTLDLLQRDSGALERALQDAGVKTDSGSLAFDLKNSHRDARPADQQAPDGGLSDLAAQSDEAMLETADSRRATHHGLVDLSV